MLPTARALSDDDIWWRLQECYRPRRLTKKLNLLSLLRVLHDKALQSVLALFPWAQAGGPQLESACPDQFSQPESCVNVLSVSLPTAFNQKSDATTKATVPGCTSR